MFLKPLRLLRPLMSTERAETSAEAGDVTAGAAEATAARPVTKTAESFIV